MTDVDLSLIFYGTRGPRDAKVMVVGESWGSTEESLRKPFVGSSGEELNRILAEGGINPAEVFFTNVVSARPPGNDMSTFFYSTQEAKQERPSEVRGLYPKPIVRNGLEILQLQIQLVKPDLIIGFGNYALWALTESSFKVANSTSKHDKKSRKVPTGITSWRGSQLYTRDGRCFLPTYHPAAILRQWSWRAVAVHDLKTRAPLASPLGWTNEPCYHFALRPTFQETKTWLNYLLDRLNGSLRVPVAVDLETRAGHIACCGLATSAHSAISIPFMCVEDHAGYFSEYEESEIVALLLDVFSHPSFFLIGQNFLYDAQYIARHWYFKADLSYGKAHDTLVAQHLLFPGTPKGLDYLSSLYCAHHVYWKDEGKEWDPNVGEEQLWEYNCKDACKTFEIAHVQTEVIAQQELSNPWVYECDQLPLMLEMMLRGVLINQRTRMNQIFELDRAIKAREQILNHIIPWGEDLQTKSGKSKWYYSPTQLKKLFYEEIGLKVIRNRKTGQPTTDDAALRTIENREPILEPVTRAISELRSCRVFHDNFLSSRLDSDGRMRCSYNVHPETFRWSSSESAFRTGTNLQNIPKGSEEDVET